MNSTSNLIRLPNIQCLIYRSIGFVLLGTSLINLVIIFRYFIERYCTRRTAIVHNRLSPIIIGMSISSILLICAAAPFVTAQCFSCEPWLNHRIFCPIHGFICFSTGLFHMYIIALLSFLRYLSILHKNKWLSQFLERHRGFSLVLCALLALCWSLPPFFDVGTRYTQEDSGFYCSLKWDDRAISSRIFILSMIIFNFVVPFGFVIYTNLSVWRILRRLIQSYYNSNRSFSSISTPVSTTHMLSSLSPPSDAIHLSIRFRKCLTDAQLKETINRLQRLKIDQRYALITGLIAIQYLVVWTPYTFVVMMKVAGQSVFFEKYPYLPTLLALIAKISVILNPLILIYTSRMTRP